MAFNKHPTVLVTHNTKKPLGMKTIPESYEIYVFWMTKLVGVQGFLRTQK